MADRLDAIRARVRAASREPWETSIVDPGVILVGGKPIAVCGGNQQDYCNAEFAARARTDVPWLLAELDRERAARIEAEAKLAIREQQLARLDDELVRLRDALAKEERLHGETIDDRDHFQYMADKLAYAVAPEEVIGEHSSHNCPWANALDLITPMAEVDKLREENAGYERDLAIPGEAATA